MKNIISKRIEQLRVEYKLTQKDFAEKIGVTPSAVGMWERNERTPDVLMLINICEIFDVKINYFFQEDYDKLNPYALVVADAKAKKISAEQLRELINVLGKY